MITYHILTIITIITIIMIIIIICIIIIITKNEKNKANPTNNHQQPPIAPYPEQTIVKLQQNHQHEVQWIYSIAEPK